MNNKTRKWGKENQKVLYAFIFISNSIWLYFQDLSVSKFVVLLLFSTVLLLGAAIDKQYYILPDEGAILLTIGGCVMSYYEGKHMLVLIGGAFGIMLLCLIIRVVSSDGLGWGDIKWFGALACWQSIPGLWIMFTTSFVVGCIYLLFINSSYSRTDKIPFGPFLCFSGWFSYFFTPHVIRWYVWMNVNLQDIISNRGLF